MTTDTHHLEYDAQGSGNGDNILAKGTILDRDRYEIAKILGLGGMGSVYLARDLRFRDINRMCAIKEMTIQSPDPGFRKLAMENFKREANTLAALNHPAIVKIFDFFNDGNRVYLVMEYVEGQDLEEVVSSLPDHEFLAEERVLKWGIQICDMLTFLHESKTPIVYRDLKPPNLILRADQSDSLVLIDFGIAKVFQEGQRGTMMGTEGYSPPEQYKGIASPQGDVYALGATLHHLITRRDPKLEPPFSFHEALPSQLNPNVSELAEIAILKALEYDREKRYQSAAEMKLALEKALDAHRKPRRANTGFQPNTTYQQPPVSGGGASTTFLPPEKSQPPQPGYPQQPMAGYPQQPTPGYPQQPMPGYPQQPMPGYPQQPMPGYPQQPMPGYPQQPMAGQYPSQIEAPDIVTSKSDVVPVWSFRCEDEVRSSPIVGENLVYVGAYDNNLYAVDAKTGKFRWKYPTDGGIASTPFFYKDRVLFGSEDRLVYAVTARDGKILWSCPTEDKVRSSVRVEFEHAFFGSDDGRLYAANVRSGRIVWRFEAGGPIRSTPIIDEKEEIVYVGCEDGNLYALELQTGKMKWKFRTARGIISSPTLYEDLVLFGSRDRTFYALDKRTGWAIWKQNTGDAIYSSPTVAEEVVYFGSTDQYLYALDVTSGKVRWKFKAGSQVNTKPAVSEEAAFFGTSSGAVISVYIKTGRERWRFQTNGTVPSSPALGDGVVYIGSTDHRLYALPA